MMETPWRRWAIAASGTAGVVIAVLLLVWLFKSCQPAPQPKIDPKTQKSIDSLDATKPGFEKTKDSVITIVRHDTIFAKAVNGSAERSKASAAATGRLADSLAAVARLAKTAADSAARWHAAYDERTKERDTLLVTVAKKDSVIRYERDARIGLGILYGADTLRRIAIEKVNEGLKKDINKLQQPCTVPGTFGKVPCPSRTVTMVVSVLGVLGVQEAAKIAQKSTKP
jgi:hypothetical protein